MHYLVDKADDNWSSLTYDGVVWGVVYDDGTKEDLRPHHVLITRGKQSGKKLSEIDDRGYLQWLRKMCSEEGNVFLGYVTGLRLAELV